MNTDRLAHSPVIAKSFVLSMLLVRKLLATTDLEFKSTQRPQSRMHMRKGGGRAIPRRVCCPRSCARMRALKAAVSEAPQARCNGDSNPGASGARTQPRGGREYHMQ
jgi:hypothetical protein